MVMRLPNKSVTNFIKKVLIYPGEGKFSKVYKAKTQTGDIVAIKRINVSKLSNSF
jgi:hypothetical protein